MQCTGGLMARKLPGIYETSLHQLHTFQSFKTPLTRSQDRPTVNTTSTPFRILHITSS